MPLNCSNISISIIKNVSYHRIALKRLSVRTIASTAPHAQKAQFLRCEKFSKRSFWVQMLCKPPAHTQSEETQSFFAKFLLLLAARMVSRWACGDASGPLFATHSPSGHTTTAWSPHTTLSFSTTRFLLESQPDAVDPPATLARSTPSVPHFIIPR